MNAETWRLSFFLGGLVIFASCEFFLSYRQRTYKRVQRWWGNLGLAICPSLLLKLLLPGGLMVLADRVSGNHIGLFNHFEFSGALSLILGLIIFDLAIYLQHVLVHKVPLLWRFHRVHHSDVDLDVTSALRFHPVEILFSLSYKILIIIMFGLSAETILIFEILLNFMAMFNHSNMAIHPRLEGLLRGVIVTPQMHIIHHSIDRNESDLNYGFNLSIWDRLFKTYQKSFKSEGVIGQETDRKISDQVLIKLLIQPFKSKRS